uniref:B12-binding domain-containing radical SAM protein n=1 Tax=Eubacterium cellulosolvens TaxID=29322 RepID=UPI0004844670|nr:B12-binding domain-containing radical SAM protein [[Eubacterium] cellulosolvens]
MKILLAAVNAKYIHSNLAVRTLESYARTHLTSGEMPELEIHEYTINEQKDHILADLYRRRPDVITFSCYIWNMEIIFSLAKTLKLILPDVPIWLGGPEVSFDAAKILREHEEIAGIMTGEGEATFAGLMRFFAGAVRADGDLPENLTGVVWRKSDGRIVTAPPTPPLALDEIPFFYRDMAGEEGMEVFRHRIIYYESSRGCPFSCSYCLSSLREKVRFRSLEKVCEELQFFLDAGVPQVKFVDRTFNCNHRHAQGIWTYIREHDNKVTNFHFEIAADLLTDEEIELLSTLRPGLVQLEIGVQSTNPDTLEAIDRVQNMDHLRSVTDRIRAGANIHQHLDLIAGLPYEDVATFRRSFDEVYAMKPQQFQLGFLKVLKGSAMHRRAEEFGIVYHAEAPYEVIRTNWLSYSDVLYLKGVEEMTEVYYNSCQFVYTMEALTEETGSAFDTYAAIADWYDRNFDRDVQHSRMARFTILRDFIRDRFPERQKYYESLLLLDLYLRENAKSRPAWAPDPAPWKPLFQEYYREHAEGRIDRRMMHGEVFDVDIFGIGGEGPWPVVFDYRSRDPLTGNARVVHVNTRK